VTYFRIDKLDDYNALTATEFIGRESMLCTRYYHSNPWIVSAYRFRINSGVCCGNVIENNFTISKSQALPRIGITSSALILKTLAPKNEYLFHTTLSVDYNS
jgi:hypothetical protein